MNTPQPIPQPTPLVPVKKPTLYNVVLMYDLDYPILQTLAEMAKVQQGTMDAMVTTVAIHRVDAEKILATFSEYTGVNWTFDNMRVALLPTFSEIVDTHKLDLNELATLADVPFALINMMFSNERVPEYEAVIVLGIVSLRTGRKYNLENVDVALTKEG